MKQRRRIYYAAVQRSEIWDRWQAGESMSSIGRRFDRESSSVFSVISPTGGIRPPEGTGPNRSSVFLNERRSLGGSACAARYGRLRATWDDLRRPSAARSVGREERTATGLRGQIKPLGIGRGVPSSASWLAARS